MCSDSTSAESWRSLESTQIPIFSHRAHLGESWKEPTFISVHNFPFLLLDALNKLIAAASEILRGNVVEAYPLLHDFEGINFPLDLITTVATAYNVFRRLAVRREEHIRRRRVATYHSILPLLPSFASFFFKASTAE